MSFSNFLIALIPAIAAFVTGGIAVYAWQHREVIGARSFALCSASTFIWCFFSVFEQLAMSENARIVFGKAQYFGISFFPVFWLVFALRYAQCDAWLTRKLMAAISLIPTASLLLALSDHWHGWVWHSVALKTDPYYHLVIVHGWWFNYVMIPQCYALIIAGFGVLLSALFSGSQLYRRQTLLVLAAALAPFVCNVLYVISGITLYGLDLTPVGFAIAGFLIQFGLFRTRFLEIAPVSYKTVFLNTTDAVILLDAQRRIVDLNPSASLECGLITSEKQLRSRRAADKQLKNNSAIGRSFEQIFPQYGELAREAIFWEMDTQAGASDLTKTVQVPSYSKLSGLPQVMYREIKVSALQSPGNRRVGWVIMIRDVTLGKQQQAQLEQLAYVDSLTGLYNRRQLELEAQSVLHQQALTTESMSAAEPISRSTDRKTHYSAALLYIDLNRFKPINDNYGHDVGDMVLKHFAQCLKRSVRKGDMVVRLGGDEFAALLYQADRKAAIEVRNRLYKILDNTVRLAGHYFTLSASVGIACYPNDGYSLKALLHHADQQMYSEKRLIKDSYRQTR